MLSNRHAEITPKIEDRQISKTYTPVTPIIEIAEVLSEHFNTSSDMTLRIMSLSVIRGSLENLI
jgi:hypothetical protein